MTWLKENWFKVGILVAVLAAIATYATLEINKMASEDQPASESEPIIVERRAATPDTTNSTPPETKSAAVTSPPVQSQKQESEDSLLKIERCKTEAQLASEERRYSNAIGIELLNCYSDSSCNYDNTKYFLEGLLENSQQSTYEKTYNRCLTSSKTEFESDNRTIEAYWQQCESAHAGDLGLALYNERLECVASLIQTQGL